MTGGRVAAVRDDRVGDEPFEMEICVVIDRVTYEPVEEIKTGKDYFFFLRSL